MTPPSESFFLSLSIKCDGLDHIDLSSPLCDFVFMNFCLMLFDFLPPDHPSTFFFFFLTAESLCQSAAHQHLFFFNLCSLWMSGSRRRLEESTFSPDFARKERF